MPANEIGRRWIPETMHGSGWRVMLVWKDDNSITFKVYHYDKEGNATLVSKRSHSNIKDRKRQQKYLHKIFEEKNYRLPTPDEEKLEAVIGIEPGSEIFSETSPYSYKPRTERISSPLAYKSGTTPLVDPRGFDLRQRASLTEQSLGALELKPITSGRTKKLRAMALKANSWKNTGLPNSEANVEMLRKNRPIAEIAVKSLSIGDKAVEMLFTLDMSGLEETVTPAPILPWERVQDPVTGKWTTRAEGTGQRMRREARESREAREKDLIKEEIREMTPSEREALGVGEIGSEDEKKYVEKKLREEMDVYEGKIPRKWPTRDREIARAIEVSGYPYESLSERDKLIRRMRMEDIQEAYRTMTPEVEIPEQYKEELLLEHLPKTKEYFEGEGYDIEDLAKEAIEAEYPETLELIVALRNEGYPEQYLPSAAQLQNMDFEWDKYYDKYGYLFDQTSGGDFYKRKAEEYKLRAAKLLELETGLKEMGHSDADIATFLERPWMAEGMLMDKKKYEAPKPFYEAFTRGASDSPMAVAMEARQREEEQMAQSEGEPMRTYEEVIQAQPVPPISFIHETPVGETTVPVEYFRGMEHWDLIDSLKELGYDEEAQKALGFCQDSETCRYIIDNEIRIENLGDFVQDSEEKLLDQGFSSDEARILAGLQGAYLEFKEPEDSWQERELEEEIRAKGMEVLGDEEKVIESIDKIREEIQEIRELGETGIVEDVKESEEQ